MHAHHAWLRPGTRMCSWPDGPSAWCCVVNSIADDPHSYSKQVLLSNRTTPLSFSLFRRAWEWGSSLSLALHVVPVIPQSSWLIFLSFSSLFFLPAVTARSPCTPTHMHIIAPTH
jgi:hypothetical protein